MNEGNAVVAVRYSNGNVAWSWHIWATRYDPDQDYDTYYTYPLSPRVTGKYNLAATPSYHYAVMKYNLGADATAAEGSIGLHGLLYQWGRKDPLSDRAHTLVLEPILPRPPMRQGMSGKQFLIPQQ